MQHGRRGFLKCQVLTVVDKAEISSMYSIKKDSITVPIDLCMWHKKTEVEALLNCGATENFIDTQTLKKLGMGTCLLQHPRMVQNVDGTENQASTITKYCNLYVKKGQEKKKQRFFVANLGRDCLILGHPWFQAFNPQINWAKNKLEGENIVIETAGYQSKKTTQIDNIAQQWAKCTAQNKPTQIPEIPKEYQHHAVVFLEKAAQRFPPACEEDHVITLKPGAPTTLNCKVYPLTSGEAEATKEFLKEHLEKGYIVESNSPYASSFFFRKKKDGKLRPIMDYRPLNSWTVRDTYPLPLISTILEQLQGKTIFTKFDIRWGYNNIRIWEEDQWAAAFKTPFGLFQPHVMFFSLTNSPATFSCAMNRMFRRLTNKYPTKLFIYMDDILIATGGDLPRH